MPQKKNAIKALRQTEKRTLRNQAVIKNIKFLLKTAKKEAEAKDKKALETVKSAVRAIDKASQRGILKPNNAARKKSRTIHEVNRLLEEKK